MLSYLGSLFNLFIISLIFSFDIYSLQVKGTVRVGVLGGIGVRDISIDLSLGTIDVSKILFLYKFVTNI